jgi:hypothetical protein
MSELKVEIQTETVPRADASASPFVLAIEVEVTQFMTYESRSAVSDISAVFPAPD